jgi:hypothetical protein
MKTNYLFPHRFRTVSGALFVLSLAALILFMSIGNTEDFTVPVFAIVGAEDLMGPHKYFTVIENPVMDEIIILALISSGIVFGFSKEKHEDEMVASIRLNSLAWATIANYGILFFCYLFVYGLPFFNILLHAMLSQLVIFVLLFRYKMYRFYNFGQDEE